MPTLHDICRSALRSLIPPPRIAPSQWVEQNIRLPEGVSALPGEVRLWPTSPREQRSHHRARHAGQATVAAPAGGARRGEWTSRHHRDTLRSIFVFGIEQTAARRHVRLTSAGRPEVKRTLMSNELIFRITVAVLGVLPIAFAAIVLFME